jgi:chromosome partitioning protein
MSTVAFCSPVTGVGQSTLLYHLAWMLADRGYRPLLVDLDPQSGLTIQALPPSRIAELWPEGDHPDTIHGAVQAHVSEGAGECDVHVEPLSEAVGLLVGDLALACLEEPLAAAWVACSEGDDRSLRLSAALGRVIARGRTIHEADIVLLDVGSNLGALSRAALLAASHVIVPVTTDLLALQGLRNLGPSLSRWRESWRSIALKVKDADPSLPSGQMTPAGYVLIQPVMYLGVPTLAPLPGAVDLDTTYRQYVGAARPLVTVPGGEACQIGRVRHHRDLVTLAMPTRKPMFALKPADGAVGAYQSSVLQCHEDFRLLAEAVIQTCR